MTQFVSACSEAANSTAAAATLDACCDAISARTTSKNMKILRSRMRISHALMIAVDGCGDCDSASNRGASNPRCWRSVSSSEHSKKNLWSERKQMNEMTSEEMTIERRLMNLNYLCFIENRDGDATTKTNGVSFHENDLMIASNSPYYCSSYLIKLLALKKMKKVKAGIGLSSRRLRLRRNHLHRCGIVNDRDRK